MDSFPMFRDVDYDDLMSTVIEEARTYNTSTLITYSGYAIAGFAVAFAVALLIFYVLGVGSTRRRVYDQYQDDYGYGRSFNFNSGPSYEVTTSLLLILEELEKAFASYSVDGKSKCRQRVVCEALLPLGASVNKGAATTFSKIFSQEVRLDKASDSQEDVELWETLRAAAVRGRQDLGCGEYIDQCPEVTLVDLPQF